MSIISAQTLQRVPRAVVRTGLRVGRLPLSAMILTIRPQDPAVWPPVLAYDGFAAEITSVAGAMLKDEHLAAQGRALAERLEALRQAEAARTLATIERERATSTVTNARESAQTKRENNATAAADRAQELRQRKATTKKQVDMRARNAAEAAQADRRQATKALAKQSTRAKKVVLTQDAAALRNERVAVDATAAAAALDSTIEASKANRATD